MPGEIIDTAYVEIQPILAPGFQGQVATGLRRGTAGTAGREGALAGGVFGKEFVKGFAGLTIASIGVEKLAEGLHEGVVNAGLLQKQGEALDAVFGENAEHLKDFAESTHEFGLSALASEQLSVRIGILSHTLGIAKPQAAEMSENLQRLGGAIAEIRGLDPATVLQKLPLVLAGNLRTLKELGFAFTPLQIKSEAVAKGFIRQGQAIDPTSRALAIYSLLVKQLPFFEDQAAKHTDDLTNRQHRQAATQEDLGEKTGQLVRGPYSALIGRLLEIEDGAIKGGEALGGLQGKIEKFVDSRVGSDSFFGKIFSGHQISDALTSSIVKPFEITADHVTKISQQLGLIEKPHTVTIGVQFQSVNPNDPISKLLFGGPLSNPLSGPGFNTGVGAQPPRIFGPGFKLPEAPEVPKLAATLRADQQAVFTRLQDNVEIARASGSDAKLKGALAALRAAYVNLSNNVKESLAIRRQARVAIAQIDEQVRGVDQAAADDAKNAAADAKSAREQRQDAVLANMTSAADFARQAAAATTTTLRDDIAAERHYIATLQAEVAILKKSHRDASALTNQIKTERLALAGLVAQQAADRAAAVEDRLQDLLTIAETTKGIGDDRRQLTALERFYQSKVDAADRGSVARRKWLVKLRQTQQQIRELKDEQDKTNEAQAAAVRAQQFNFLTTQRGFFANLAGNLLGGDVSGLVGTSPTQPINPNAPTPAPHPDTVSAVAARSRDPRDPSSSQLDQLISLSRQTVNVLQRLASDHPHAQVRETNALVHAASDAGGAR